MDDHVITLETDGGDEGRRSLRLSRSGTELASLDDKVATRDTMGVCVGSMCPLDLWQHIYSVRMSA